MSVILSCGHREDDFDKHHSIMTKDQDITEDGWVKAVGYRTVCLSCYKQYESNAMLLYSDKEAEEWLHND